MKAVIQVDRTGVHSSHCCAEHGCKYGNPDCPVVKGTVKQLYPCEECGEDEPEITHLRAVNKELLEALQMVLDGHEEGESLQRALPFVEAALAKAKGQGGE